MGLYLVSIVSDGHYCGTDLKSKMVVTTNYIITLDLKLPLEAT